MSETRLNCRQEEIIPVSELVWKSCIRDKAKFSTFSPMYNELFFTTEDKAIKDLKLLIHPQVMVAEGKEYTKEINKMMEAFRPRLNAIESYVEKADGQLTAAPADFGFKIIRNNISAGNKEGVVEHLEVLIQLVTRNQEAIRLQGLTEEAQTELETATTELDAYSIQKGTQIQDTGKLVIKYGKELKSLKSRIMSICKDGKIISAQTEPEKVKDYTFTQVLKLVRNAAPKGDTPPTV